MRRRIRRRRKKKRRKRRRRRKRRSESSGSIVMCISVVHLQMTSIFVSAAAQRMKLRLMRLPIWTLS